MGIDCGLCCPQCRSNKVASGWKGPAVDDKDTETFYGGSVELGEYESKKMGYQFETSIVTYTCECGCRFAVEGS